MSTVDEINERRKKLFEQAHNQFDRFLQEAAQLDLAWEQNTLVELLHEMAAKAREEYEESLNKPVAEGDPKEPTEGGIYET